MIDDDDTQPSAVTPSAPIADAAVPAGTEAAPEFTTEELGDYLDRGREPYDPRIEESAEHRATLRALERLRSLSGAVIEADAGDLDALPAGWFGEVMGNVRREARAGRTIPLSSPSPELSLTVTEGAVRGLVRAAGDSVPGVLVGRCVLHGDVTKAGEPIRVELTASVFWGTPMAAAARTVRERVHSGLLAHTELRVGAIDVLIDDVYLPGGGAPGADSDDPAAGDRTGETR